MAAINQYTHRQLLKRSWASKAKRRLENRAKHPGVKEAQAKHAVRRERNKILQRVPRSERRALRRRFGKAGAIAWIEENIDESMYEQ